MSVAQAKIRLDFLRSCWMAVGLLLLYLSLSFFCLSQQWPVKLPNAIVESKDTTPHGAALYGLLACLPLFAGELLLGWRYRVVSRGTGWRQRLPVPPLLDGGDENWPEWRGSQILLVFAFHILPAVLLAYFCLRFLAGTARVRGISISAWDHLWPPVGWTEGLGKYAPDGKLEPDYLRFWEPWLLLLLVSVSLLCLAVHLRKLFRKTGPKAVH